jgi:hypothetical protein
MNIVNLISRKNITSLISNDVDNYVSNMTSYDLYARKATSKEDYITKCKNDFSVNKEIETKCFEKCMKCIPEANKRLLQLTPSFQNIEWNLFFFSGNYYEDGLSHTRFNIIFLPVKIINVDDEYLTKLLIHEKIHILQKLLPFDQFVTSFMKNFQVVNHKNFVNNLIRANPDTDNFVYKDFNNQFLQFVYKTPYPISIRDVIQYSDFEHPYEQMAYLYSRL